MIHCPKCKGDLEWRAGSNNHACLCGSKEQADSPSGAAACSRIVGYRLEDGTDYAELYFLAGRPAQKTLNQMAELIKCGWLVTNIICSENINAEALDRDLEQDGREDRSLLPSGYQPVMTPAIVSELLEQNANVEPAAATQAKNETGA